MRRNFSIAFLKQLVVLPANEYELMTSDSYLKTVQCVHHHAHINKSVNGMIGEVLD